MLGYTYRGGQWNGLVEGSGKDFFYDLAMVYLVGIFYGFGDFSDSVE